jgi:hypothetical protein
LDTSGRRLQKQGRQVTAQEYPQELACHNPECQDGGFDIGERITALLASKEYYEQNSLGGERDAQWPGFYAAYVLGRVGDFAAPSALAGWLDSAPGGDDWAGQAAAWVLSKMER